MVKENEGIFCRKPPPKKTPPATLQYLKRGGGVFLKSHIFASVTGAFQQKIQIKCKLLQNVYHKTEKQPRALSLGFIGKTRNKRTSLC